MMKVNKYPNFLVNFIKLHHSRFSDIELRLYLFLFTVLAIKGRSQFSIYFDELVYGWYDFDFSKNTPAITRTGLTENKVKTAMFLVARKKIFTFELDRETNLFQVKFNENEFNRL